MRNLSDPKKNIPTIDSIRVTQSAASLGSLAAVAAWCMSGNAEAAPSLSTTTVNVHLTNGAQFDINGDGRMDFNIYFNNSQEMVLQGLNGSLTSASTVYGRYYPYTKVLNVGTPVDANLPYASYTDLSYTGNTNSPAALGTFSTGVEFYDINNALHYSWVSFNFPGNNVPWTGSLAVAAGWESTANTAILVGAVPEPSAAMLGSMALVLCLAGGWVKRRLRRP